MRNAPSDSYESPSNGTSSPESLSRRMFPKGVKPTEAAHGLRERGAAYDAATNREKEAQKEYDAVARLERGAPEPQREALRSLMQKAWLRVEEARREREAMTAEVGGARGAWRADRREQLRELRAILDTTMSRYARLEALLADNGEESRLHDLVDTMLRMDAGAVNDGLLSMWEESFSALVARLSEALGGHTDFTEEAARLGALSGSPAERFDAYLALKQEIIARLHDPQGLLHREKEKRARQKARLNRIEERGRIYADEETLRDRQGRLESMSALDLSLRQEKEEFNRQYNHPSGESPALATRFLNLAETRKHNILQLVDMHSLLPVDEARRSIISFSSYDSLPHLLAASGKKDAEAYFSSLNSERDRAPYEYALAERMRDLVRMMGHLPRESNHAYRVENREISSSDIEVCRMMFRNIEVVLPVLKVCAAASAVEEQTARRDGSPTLEWFYRISRVLSSYGPSSAKEELDRVYAHAGAQPGVPSRAECERALAQWNELLKEWKDVRLDRTAPADIREEEYEEHVMLLEGEAEFWELEAALLANIEEIARVESQRVEAEAAQAEIAAERSQAIANAREALEAGRGEWQRYRADMDVFNTEYRANYDAAETITTKIEAKRREIEANKDGWFKKGLIARLEKDIAELTEERDKKRLAYQTYENERPRTPLTTLQTLESDLRSAEQRSATAWKMQQYQEARTACLRRVGESLSRITGLFNRNKPLAAAHPESLPLSNYYDRSVRGLSEQWRHAALLQAFYADRHGTPEIMPTAEALAEVPQEAKRLQAEAEATRRELRRLKKPWEYHY